MKKWLIIIGVGLLLVYWIYPRSYNAVAKLENDLSITMTVTPMLGHHSDWERQIIIQTRSSRIEMDLFEDTGWWRGSHLYRHSSGAYVLHEGQAGCFGFTLEPLIFAVQEDISCDKIEEKNEQNNQTSRYYENMTYLGTFIETSNDPNGLHVRFLGYIERPEVELPDIL